jgi:acetyl-CoA carboxylase carboxyl transferase subunit alpha
MGITADRLSKLNLVDEVLKEPLGGAHRDPLSMAEAVKVALLKYLDELGALSKDELLAQRHARLRAQGVYRAE